MNTIIVKDKCQQHDVFKCSILMCLDLYLYSVVGEVVSGYRVRDGEWNEIGRMSPQKPQVHYKLNVLKHLNISNT